MAVCCLHTSFAKDKKERKKIKAVRITKEPKIDGVLDDEAWKNAELATDFVIFRPENGQAVTEDYQTTVRIVYDDNAIFISAQMNDPNPS